MSLLCARARLLAEMARDEKWSSQIIEEPVVAGVENVTALSVDIRVMIKTRPGKQWGVAREARRRIKKRFNELGVKIPFPHRIMHQLYESGEEGSGAKGLPGAPKQAGAPQDG